MISINQINIKSFIKYQFISKKPITYKDILIYAF